MRSSHIPIILRPRTSAGGGGSGNISILATLSPSPVNFTTGSYDDWVMDTSAAFATWRRKGNSVGPTTVGLIALSSVNMTFPLWGHGGTANTADAGDCNVDAASSTASPLGHDQIGAGNVNLILDFPAASATHHAYVYFQPDTTDAMSIRFSLSDASASSQLLSVPAQGSETARLYTVTYNSAGAGTLRVSLETGAGLSTNSYFLFNSAGYKAS